MTGSWNDLTTPTARGRMFILDDFQEAIGEANLINGFDLNTADPNELEISKETLLDQKEFARGFSTNSRPEPGQRAPPSIHQAWNGDIVNVRNQVDDPENYQLRDLLGGRAGRHRPDVHPDHRALARDRADVHGLAPRARERGPQRQLERLPATGRGRPQAFAELVKEEPSIDVDLEELGDGGLEYRLDEPDDRGALDRRSSPR